ncbi:MAG: hypothetical protein V2G42_07780 [bacterium JZ-2024 1]
MARPHQRLNASENEQLIQVFLMAWLSELPANVDFYSLKPYSWRKSFRRRRYESHQDP